MPQQLSIRFQFALVFLLFFLLVVVLGLFSISRLSHFNKLSADVAERWLPYTRALGDLNNFTSDFRAIEGSFLLSADNLEIADTETKMEELDHSIAEAERNFERIRHEGTEGSLYNQFKERWNDYRATVNRMIVLSRTGRKPEALSIYLNDSHSAYAAASDTLGYLTTRVVVSAQAASARLAAAYKQAFWLIGLTMLLATLLVAAALVHVSRFISAPLLRLADCMRRLALNDIDIHIADTERRDEIGEMARAAVVFRNNAIELMRSQRVLGEQAAVLEQQLAYEQSLALQQRNFVTMASHEFRTPLTVIDGHARRLIKVKDRVNADEIGERAGKVRSAVLRMTHLIDDLLNSSRLVNSGTELHFKPTEIDLGPMLHGVCQLHREMSPGTPILERVSAAPLWTTGDAGLLLQAFGNLLSNAVKYSPDGGIIELTAEIVSEHVAISVQDHGIGIPESDFDQLFERYHRGSNVSGIVGTGVGLYLVKMVVDLHGGTIDFESKVGQGSRFTIRLPLKAAPAASPLSSLMPSANETLAKQH